MLLQKASNIPLIYIENLIKSIIALLGILCFRQLVFDKQGGGLNLRYLGGYLLISFIFKNITTCNVFVNEQWFFYFKKDVGGCLHDRPSWDHLHPPNVKQIQIN